MFETGTDSPGPKLEAPSPAPSCDFKRSDQPVDPPAGSLDGLYRDRFASPAPSYVSMKSDQSMNRPVVFGEVTDVLRSTSPTPSFISMKSNKSMNRPVVFNREADIPSLHQDRFASPAPSCVSMKSDQSMTRPDVFNREIDILSLHQDRFASPAPSFVSMKSDQSMTRPDVFTRETHVKRESDTSLQDHLKCPVCMDVLKEPVSIPCGHSFCKTCIHTYWSRPIHAGSFPCPQCKKRFKTRPVLNPNVALTNVVQTLQQAGIGSALPARSYAEPGDVACDLCTEQKIRAVKSCLTCCLSYCESHVKHHYTVPALQRHTLSEVTGELKQRICLLHHRALEVFCKTDQAFICVACAIEEHKEHETLITKSEAPVAEKLPFKAITDSTSENMIEQLINHTEELKAKVQRAEIAWSDLAKHSFKGFGYHDDLTSDFVEVAALGRQLDLGMLYDCRSDFFSSDVFLWDQETISSMRMSIPRPQRGLKILEVDNLQERLKTLDLTLPVRASVLSGLIEPAGAAAFLNHPTQLQLQDRVTLYSRTSTRLDLLSHNLLYSGSNISGISLTKATHVVMAVLYGTQASFVFDAKNGKSGNTLKDVVNKMAECSCKTELLSSLNENEKESCLLYDCTLYIDGEVSESRVNFDTAVNIYSSLQKSDDSETTREFPLKVWLYPLKNLDQSSAYVVKDISEGHLIKAEKVLGNLQTALSISQHVVSSYKSHDVVTWFPALEGTLSKFFSLLVQYQSGFRTKLAFCIHSIREKGEKGEKSLPDLLKSHDQSPFNSHNIDQWLQNKDAEVRALNECRSANITIVKSSNDLQRIVEDSQADRVLCFTLTSLEVEDPYLSAMTHHVIFMNIRITTKEQPSFTLPDRRQKILSDLQTFHSIKKEENNAQQIMFIAASIADPLVPGSCVRLYQSGSLVSCSVRLDVKPETPKLFRIKQTSVTLKLQSSKNQKTERYRVEYREATQGTGTVFMKWTVIETPCTEETCVISGLAPETKYQLRYAVMDSKEMSDYSTITEVLTIPVPKPGPPTVFNQNKESHIIRWQKPETVEDYPTVCYKLDYMEAGLEGWQSIQTAGPECEYTITVPYSTCYRARVSAVYADGKVSSPSEETTVPVRAWSIDLSKRKASIFLEVLKHQTEKKSVTLRDCTDEESEVRSFLQCLPYISKLIFASSHYSTKSPEEWRQRISSFLLNLCLQAALHQKETFQQNLKTCFPNFMTNQELSLFLLDLYSHLKDYEIQTDSSILPALRSVMSVPEFWTINLSKTKVSLFLEVLKLQRSKKPVKLTGWTEKESEMSYFLQCLQYISDLRFVPSHYPTKSNEEWRKRMRSFLLNLFLQAALHQRETFQQTLNKCLPNFKTNQELSVFLLDLYSHVKDYEIQTGSSVLPALRSEYQSVPESWTINLSETKASLFLEVLKLQTKKKSVKLTGWTDKESEMRNFLQCLQYISDLRFIPPHYLIELPEEWRKRMRSFLLNLCLQAALHQSEAFQQTLNKCLPNFMTNQEESVFLLDLYSHLKDYEIQTGSSVLPALRSVYQSVPESWTINLSETKASLFLEVLKLQTKKKPVELTGWTDRESEMRDFLQCLQYISDLRFAPPHYLIESPEEWRKRIRSFLLNLFLQAALHQGETFQQTLNKCLPNFMTNQEESVFLLDLYSHLKEYEIQTGSSVLPALRSVYQSVPAVWIINLSETKASLFLEVLKLQTKKKSVELTGWTERESEMRNFLQCLQYISDLRFNLSHNRTESHQEQEKKVRTFLLDLCLQAALHQPDLIQTAVEKCVLPHFKTDKVLSSFLLDLYLHVKNYEIQTDQSVLPALKHFYQYIPIIWSIHLSETKSSLLLEVLKPQTVNEAAEWRWVTDDECEVRNLLQCLPFISELRLCNDVVFRMTTASGFRADMTLEELSLVCNVKCLNLTDYKMKAKTLEGLLNHQGPEKIRFSEETLQDLASVVYEAQEEEVTRCFLQKVGGDLISCSLNWEKIHYFQKYHVVTVDFMKSSIRPENIRDLLSVLERVQFRSCSKALLLQLLNLLDEGNEAEIVRHAVALSKALGDEVDLSETQLNMQNCRSLALFLENCEGLSRLNLSHCQLNDQKLELLLPHLHKSSFVDLRVNSISASKIHDLISKNNKIHIQISN